MPCSERFEVRLTPEVADAMNDARRLAPISRFIEAAIIDRIRAEGVEVTKPSLPPEGAPVASPEPVEHTFPRRPAPRLTGGRKKH